MPLKKILFKPGTNQENTRYTNENGWYISEKVRFRQGTPEKIGGWQRISENTYLGVCRSLFQWVTLSGSKPMGVGTNLKFYIEIGGAYYDVTPIRTTTTGTATFTATPSSPILNVYDPNNGAIEGDFVTYSLAVSLGGDITATVLNR